MPISSSYGKFKGSVKLAEKLKKLRDQGAEIKIIRNEELWSDVLKRAKTDDNIKIRPITQEEINSE